jgi:hypothetical protein
VIVYRAKRSDRIKILVWDTSVSLRRGPPCVDTRLIVSLCS